MLINLLIMLLRNNITGFRKIGSKGGVLKILTFAAEINQDCVVSRASGSLRRPVLSLCYIVFFS